MQLYRLLLLAEGVLWSIDPAKSICGRIDCMFKLIHMRFIGKKSQTTNCAQFLGANRQGLKV
jgi:hypothetical protein